VLCKEGMAASRWWQYRGNLAAAETGSLQPHWL